LPETQVAATQVLPEQVVVLTFAVGQSAQAPPHSR
jgi:hypothetical protein